MPRRCHHGFSPLASSLLSLLSDRVANGLSIELGGDARAIQDASTATSPLRRIIEVPFHWQHDTAPLQFMRWSLRPDLNRYVPAGQQCLEFQEYR
jgi:hypothetical protein